MQDATNAILGRLLREMVVIFFPNNDEDKVAAFYVWCVNNMIDKDPWSFIDVLSNSVNGDISPRWGYVFYDRLVASESVAGTPTIMAVRFIRALTNSGLTESKLLFDSYRNEMKQTS